ncbi:multicopper oxidase domain-containing protein [Micromonospora citrea]|uniref:multicopper oxidase domain-containing protein n=1 Tax=Micromonospora citrea TaxID=47855 RepID=UPI003C67CE8E
MTAGRRPLARVLAVVLVLCCGGIAVGGWAFTRAGTDTVGQVDFVRPLAVPPLATSRVDGQGRRVFDLLAREGSRDFRGDGRWTRTAGFDGDFLGPTLRAKRGERVVVNVVNRLSEETSVHWHGMHLPARMDGGPHQMIRPGATWSPTWTVDQPAATLWYHPHPHGATEEHVYRGLAGLFLLDDDREAALPLPRRYGVDDIPVIVQDRSFSAGGQFRKTRNIISSIGCSATPCWSTGPSGPTWTSPPSGYDCGWSTPPPRVSTTSASPTAAASIWSAATGDCCRVPPGWTGYGSLRGSAPRSW